MNKHKLSFGVTLAQSVLFAVGFYLFSFLCHATTHSMIAETVENSPIWQYIVEVFSAGLLFFSYRLLLGAFLSTKPMRERTLARYPRGAGFRQTLSLILSDGYYWLWLTPTLILALLPPIAGFDSLRQTFFFFASSSLAIERLAVLSTSLLLFFLLSLWAYSKLITRTRDSEALANVSARLEKERRQKERVVIPLLCFSLALAGPFVLMILVSLFSVSIAFLPIIIALVLFFFVFRALRAIRIRKKLLRKLRTLGESRRIHIGEIKHPILSLFSPRFAECFTLKANGKTYTVKLLASINRHKHIHLGDDGIGYFVRIYRLPFFGPVRRHRRGVTMTKTDAGSASELFRMQKAFSFGFEANGTKILLISPVPQDVCNLQGVPVPMGEWVGDYKVYNTTTFFSQLDLDLLDR